MFASETGRFASAGRYLQIGSTATTSSGTALADIGSIVIGAGSLTNPCHIFGHFRGTWDARDNLRILVSGMNVNANVIAGSRVGTSVKMGQFECLIGNPLAGFGLMKIIGDRGDNRELEVDLSRYSTETFSNIDSGSQITIIFQANASANFTIDSFSFQSFRSTTSGA